MSEEITTNDDVRISYTYADGTSRGITIKGASSLTDGEGADFEAQLVRAFRLIKLDLSLAVEAKKLGYVPNGNS